MKVGIPVMKCSLNPSQQRNSRTGKQSKTCGVSAAWREMNDERIGRDRTIDRNLTNRNVWMVGKTDDDVESIVEKEIVQINECRKKMGKRMLRKDAVSVAEIVEKPPIEYMSQLTYEDRVKFLSDSHDVIKELLAEWNPSWRVIEAVQHHDEFGGLSPHNHALVLLSSIDSDGVKTMQAKKELNIKFFTFINKNYAPRMRRKGYEVEDVRTYDLLTEEEKEERKANPLEHGVDAYIYKEKMKSATKLEISTLKERKADIENKMSELKKDIDGLRKEKIQIMETINDACHIEEIKAENNRLKDDNARKDILIASLQKSLQKWTQTALEWKLKFINAVKSATQYFAERFGIAFTFKESENVTIQSLVSDVNDAMQEINTAVFENGERVYKGYNYDETLKMVSAGEIGKLFSKYGSEDRKSYKL